MEYLCTDIQKPLTFVSGGHFVSKGNWLHSKRTINSFEIIVGVKGTAFIQQDETCYQVRPGCVLLLLPDHIHQGYEVSKGDASFYWFHFLCQNTYQLVDEKNIQQEVVFLKNNPYFNGLNNRVILPIFFRPSDIERVNILFHQLLHIANSKYYTPQASHYMLTSLLIELSEQAVKELPQKLNKGDSSRNLEKVIEWIRIHSCERISLEDIANRFGYNKHYLSRLFKKKMGMPTQEYIHIIKINKAKQLLYGSERSIKEIAYQLGFHDEKYFMRLFKRYEGITPTEFRNAYYKTHMNNR